MSFCLRLLPSFGYGAIVPFGNLLFALIFSCFVTFGGSSAKAEPVSIAVLGDSLVQGYGLPQELGFVPQLQNWLADHGATVTLINAGVSGDTSSGGLSRVDWTLGPGVDALIVSLGANDALRGVDPEVTRTNLNAILEVATDRSVEVLLIGIIAPSNYGPDYKESFQSIFPDLAEKFDVPLYPNFIQALVDLPDRSAVLAKFYQADALHPNADGVALIVNDMGPTVAAFAASRN